MISRFFIDRPIFASVVAIVIVLCGLLSLYMLPVESSPQITPPTVVISATYPGADAQTVMESVATPIEQELSGVEHLLYYQSSSANDGSLSITLSFEIGTDLDIAAVDVQNRIKRAERRLPEQVMRQGMSVSKRTSTFLGIIALQSDKPGHDMLFLSNYATIHMVDALARVPGVGQVRIFGNKDYSMRVSLDPDQLVLKGLTVADVAQAVREQNGLYAAGEIGGGPNPDPVEFTFPVLAPGRLTTPQQFGEIILLARPDGSRVLLKDVARVELGSLDYGTEGRYNGRPTALIPVSAQPDANALETMNGVKAALEELSRDFPEGVRHTLSLDTTTFITVSIQEVAKTFLQATILVTLVVLLFLGSWRAALIPMVAVPVAIVGTFMGLLALGFSVNSLTLFALVLAIGIVVDDAIIAVENVERIMHEEHLAPREAAIKAMGQVQGPIIASVLSLAAVYLPVAFLGGSTGVMYRQFGITITLAVAISGTIALVLTPALCRLLLRPNHQKLFLFRWFDAGVRGFTGLFAFSARWVIRLGILSMLLFGALVWTTGSLFARVPSAFVPQEDQGYLMMVAQLPQGASLDRTRAVVAQIEQFVLSQPEVRGITAMCGQDRLSNAAVPSAASMFVSLKDWSERTGPEHSADALVARISQRFGGLKEATVLAFVPPPIRGLGMRAGFEAQLEARSGDDLNALAAVMSDFIAELNRDPMFTGVSGTLNVTQPKLRVTLDHTRAKLLGIPVGEVYNTLQALLGSYYVNDFNIYGRVYRVQLQADPQFRDEPSDIRKIYVRNGAGEMIELSGVVDVAMESGPSVANRFNSFTAAQITGAPAPGFSTGQCIARVGEIAARALPPGYTIEWSSGSYQEVRTGSQSYYVMLFGLVMIFLVLAAQYEKWSLPFAVLMAVPFCVFGAFLSLFLRAAPADIYFQIGLLTLIGLSAKNAILIVEFCAKLRADGMGVVEAAVAAARIRLRPVLMTAISTILGALPLALSVGAGAAGRRSIGHSVVAGMTAATFLAVFFVPLFFVIVQWLSELGSRKPAPAAAASAAETPPPEAVKEPASPAGEDQA